MAHLVACALFLPVPLAAQESSTTAAAFRRFAERVVKVEIAEHGAAAKASLGSGFFVDGDGLLVTNYHVVAEVVREPGRYAPRVVNAAGDTLAAELLGIDVVHDLAVLRAGWTPPSWFALSNIEPDQGDRVLSLGHPRDLGLSIVEGTWNGLLRHTLYPKIHFSGSLNPGVSGGPAILPDGRVVGVNVSTEGNEISFLVPVDRVIALVDRVTAQDYARPDSLLSEAASQIRAYQDLYLTGLFEPDVPSVTIGRYRVPTRPASWFKCWGDASREPDEPYERVTHYCGTDDYLYLSEGQWTGVVEVTHEVLSTDELNRFRFYTLYETNFASGSPATWASESEVTEFRCTTRNLEREGTRLRTAICARGFRKLPGLYDVVVRAAALGAPRDGLVTSLQLSGVTWDNATRVARNFLERISWSE